MPSTAWRAGAFEILRLSDGVATLPLAVFPEAARDPAAAGLPSAAPLAIPVNAFLVRDAAGMTLIDAGTGPHRGAQLGHVPRNLRAAGIDPAAIGTILMTHLHGDHAGGLIDGEDRPVFPAARILVPQAELDFWRDEAAMARLPAFMAGTIALAQRVLAALDGQIEPVPPGVAAVPGILPVPLPGHTPGHTGFRLGGLFIWTDIVHAAAFQFAHPDWVNNFDAEAQAGIATRRRVMADVAASGEMIAGMHLGSRGRVVAEGEGFRFVPV
jgi:glyoxylase-like metal-dependent hydrolase (beta-lactamase superfamily II)